MSGPNATVKDNLSRIYSNIDTFLQRVPLEGKEAEAMVEARTLIAEVRKEFNVQSEEKEGSPNRTSSGDEKDSSGVASSRVRNTKRKSTKRKSK